MWGDAYKGQIGLFQDNKGFMLEDTSLYSSPLELDLSFLEDPPQLRVKDPYADDVPSTKKDSSSELHNSPLLKFEADKVVKVQCGGMNTALLTEQGRLYLFGQAADGQLAQQQFKGHTYFYKGSQPTYVEALHKKIVIDIQSSPSHFVALIKIP